MRYGYTPERFAHARTLTQRAAEAHDRHKEAHGEQLEATEALEAAIEYADAMLDLHVGFARILFRDEAGIRRRLGIIGERSRTFDAWVDQATQFYTAVLDDADVMTRLRDRYHITRDMLEEGQSRVQEVIRLNQKQEAEIGEAQVATQERIEAFEALDAWVDELVAVFRLLFPDSPIDRILGRDA